MIKERKPRKKKIKTITRRINMTMRLRRTMRLTNTTMRTFIMRLMTS